MHLAPAQQAVVARDTRQGLTSVSRALLLLLGSCPVSAVCVVRPRPSGGDRMATISMALSHICWLPAADKPDLGVAIRTFQNAQMRRLISFAAEAPAASLPTHDPSIPPSFAAFPWPLGVTCLEPQAQFRACFRPDTGHLVRTLQPFGFRGPNELNFAAESRPEGTRGQRHRHGLELPLPPRCNSGDTGLLGGEALLNGRAITGKSRITQFLLSTVPSRSILRPEPCPRAWTQPLSTGLHASDDLHDRPDPGCHRAASSF